jgi:hypothetical protein
MGGHLDTDAFMREAGAVAFADALRGHTSLTVLNIHGSRPALRPAACGVPFQWMYAWVSVSQWCCVCFCWWSVPRAALERAVCADNAIRDAGAVALADALMVNTTVTGLVLTGVWRVRAWALHVRAPRDVSGCSLAQAVKSATRAPALLRACCG